MSIESPRMVPFREWCSDCDGDTEHDVSIRIVTESRKRKNAKYSREPYRVSTCSLCGNEEIKRMNNA